MRVETCSPYDCCDPFLHLYAAHWVTRGPGSSVGIATELRAGRFGIASRWGRDFPPVQTGPGAHPASCKMVTRSFLGVKCGRGVLLTTHPLLVPRSWKSRAIRTYTCPVGHIGPVTGKFYLHLYIELCSSDSVGDTKLSDGRNLRHSKAVCS